jgi:hypothetical protein
MKEWMITRLSNEVNGKKLVEALHILWVLATCLLKMVKEKLAFVKMMAKSRSGVTITFIFTSCNRSGCYCRGKPLHGPYLKVYKNGHWESIGTDQSKLKPILAHYVSETDVDDVLAVNSLRVRVLKVYNRLGQILNELGIVE